jgi:tetratricopeptide (TPR) repeat protein
MNRHLLIPALAITLLVPALDACNSRPAVEMPAAAATFTIPELKARPASLNAREFGLVKKKVDGLVARIRANPDDAKSLVLLARLYMTEARITGDHPYYYPAAEKLLDRAMQADPSFAPALIAKGSVLLSLHRFADALEVGKRAVVVAPKEAACYGILCDAYGELGNYPEAIKAADAMVAVRPDLMSYSRVSYMRELHGDDAGAIEAMSMAVQAGVPSFEETAWARYTLGNLYRQQGDLKSAERAYQMAIAERDGYPFALAGLAHIEAVKGNNALAIRMLDTAASLMPEYSFIELKGEILRVAGETRAADSLVAVVERMLADDEAAGHRVDLAYALLYNTNRIKPEAALERAQKELSLRPDNLEAQHGMAFALFRAGRIAEAKDYITRAMRTGWTRPDLLAHAGLIDAAAGNHDAARAMLMKALGNGRELSPLLLQEVRGVLAAK